MEEEKLKDPGALLDLRTEEEKAKDYKFEEIVASTAPVVWKEKRENEWRSFPINDQDGSGSCVAQTLRKMMGIYIWQNTGVYVPLSASHLYQRRANKPATGMYADDAFQIAQEGITLEEFAPSEDLTDAQMDNMRVLPFMNEVGKVFSLGNYVSVPPTNVETIASIIQETGKAVMVWFWFSNGLSPKEWVDVPKVRHDLPLVGPNTARHSVAAVDFTLHNGKKALVIEDSWGLNRAIDGRRIVDEDFFRSRNYYAGHFMNFKFEDGPIDPGPWKPRYNFKRDLEFSTVVNNDPDVVALQNILKYEGLFPANVESTGYFGSITRISVGKFQIKHGILSSAQSPGYGRVGPLTRAKLNSLYN